MSKNRESNGAAMPPQLTAYANVLGEIGPKTSTATLALNAIAGTGLLSSSLKDVFRALAEELDRIDRNEEDKVDRKWSDEQASMVVDAVRQRLVDESGQLSASELKRLDLPTLRQWIRVHHDDARPVMECLMTEPPEEITIIRLFSRAGSQKLVFLGNWHIAQREVVLKRFISGSAAERVRRGNCSPIHFRWNIQTLLKLIF